MRKLIFIALALAALGVAAQAQSYTESTFYSFGSTSTDGTGPEGTVAIDKTGNLYGITLGGGSDKTVCPDGCGTIFKIDSAGNESTLYEFTSYVDPRASLTIDAAGNLYGTASEGGNTSSVYPQGLGFVFKLTTAGKYSVLHKFAASQLEGADPWGPVTLDANGNIYGTTLFGGDLSCLEGAGCGVVFEISAKGTYTILHSFSDSPDGAQPVGNLLRDGIGNIYGTTDTGGTYGSGSMFKISAGGEESVVYSFCDRNGCEGGVSPAYLVRSAAGNFYGNALDGGATNYGTIFEVSSAGAGSLIYTFCPDGESSGCSTGDHPNGPMVISGGNLFGTTTAGADGGSTGAGVVYEMSTAGVDTVLYRFLDDGSTGRDPQGISMDSAGNLYGTATSGPNGAGVVFKLTKNP